MEKKNIKLYLILIAYVIGLVLVVIHFEDIIKGIGVFFRLLTPLFIGIAIAFIFNRPYEAFRTWYHKRWNLTVKVSKILGIITIYLIALSAGILILYLVLPELGQNLTMFINNADQYLQEAQTLFNDIMTTLGLSHIDFTQLISTIEQYLATLSNTLNDMIPQIIEVTSNVISGIATAFISIALSIYIMSGKERLLMQVKRTTQVYLPKQIHQTVSNLFQIISQVFEDYVAGQCKEALILGSLCFIGMMILRLDYAGLISVVIAVTALVPIVGAYIGGAVGVLLLLFVSPAKALIFLIFLIILQQVEGNVIYPRVVGRKIGLPGMWVLVGISVGGGLFGIIGMLIGVPITTIFYQLLKKDVKRREEQHANSI